MGDCRHMRLAIVLNVPVAVKFESFGACQPSGFSTFPSSRLITLPVVGSILAKFVSITSSQAAWPLKPPARTAPIVTTKMSISASNCQSCRSL